MSYLRVTVYKDEAGEWRWKKQSANNRIIAESGEGYVDKAHAIQMAKQIAGEAPVEVDDG